MSIFKIFAAIVSMAAISVYGQIEVEDRRFGEGGQLPSKGSASAGQVNNAAELYYQVQILQQEVLQLRGLLEEQANELKKLKQQRLDDYLDLDRRLSKLGSSPAKANNEAQVIASTSGSTSSGVPADELKIYRNAIDLVLKKQDYDKAIVELNAYLASFPKGRYSANAQYWLGEIYLLKNDLEQSRQWFSRLLSEFSSHRKVPDAKFKLGKVYDLLGDKVKAKMLLQEVAASDSNAAKLAKEYLAANFSS